MSIVTHSSPKSLKQHSPPTNKGQIAESTPPMTPESLISEQPASFAIPKSSAIGSPHRRRDSNATLEPPSVEPLTPIQSEYKSAHLVASYLRLPLLLNELLGISIDPTSLETLRLFLSTRPLADRLQMRNILKGLYQHCSNLCPESDNIVEHVVRSRPTALHRADSLSESSKSYDSENESGGETPLDEMVIVEPANGPTGFHSESSMGVGRGPEFGDYPTVHSGAGGQSKLDATTCRVESSDEHSDDSKSSADDVAKNHLIYGDGIPTLSVERTKSDPRHLTNLEQNSEPKRPSQNRPSAYKKQKGVPRRSYSRMQEAIETTKSTTVSVDGPNAYDEIALKDETAMTSLSAFPMAMQSSQDFARESLEQVEQFKLPADNESTYKDIFISLKQARSDEVRWSDGSQWKGLVEAGYKDRQRGSIRYALTAIAFSRWYHDQVQLLQSTQHVATREISKRLMGDAPRDDGEKKAWDQRRKNLTTHLTRGRKWSRLVGELGFGILFKDAWALAKSPKSVLTELTSYLTEDHSKMCVLRFLGQQMDMFFEEGQTQPALLRQALEDQHLLEASPSQPAISGEVSLLQEEMRGTAPSGALLVRGTGHRFRIDTLSRLDSTEWFSDELIMLCLHLADKLSYVRVGYSIPIHQQCRPLEMMPMPFERAALQIEKWNGLEPQNRLVCFFPILQHGNHFSLLEINQRAGAIYHYDSQKGAQNDLKNACEIQFPGLPYTDQVAPHQLDGFSCGALVVAFARCRMVGRNLVPGEVGAHDAMAVRIDALELIRNAWHSGVMEPDRGLLRQKRRRKELSNGQEKRLKL